VTGRTGVHPARCFRSYDLRIADEAGRPLAAGQVGEIYLQGDCQALQYNDGLRLHVVPNVSALSAADLLRFLSERLPEYTVPNQVEFVEAVERTSSGKIRRHSAEPVKSAEWEWL
jgi:non-ribosomal peptide synthetase component E (peptide arylation enzyme)